MPRGFHHELIGALNRGKVETADRAMRRHVRFGLEPVVENIGSRAVSARFERVIVRRQRVW